MYSDCFISFEHYRIDFMTYFNLIEVINYQIGDILILKKVFLKLTTFAFEMNRIPFHILSGPLHSVVLYPSCTTSI